MEPVSGIFDNFLINLIKDAVDLSKIDKPKMKSAASLMCDAMKPATKFPADLDDKAWDMLKDAANALIDKLGVQDVAPITVGAARDYSAADVDAYLGTFGSVNEEVRAKLHRRPKTLALIQSEFSQAEQAKLVGNPFLIGLLTIFGPLVIDLVKRWLSR